MSSATRLRPRPFCASDLRWHFRPFPGLKICAAHGGWYLPSSGARSGHGRNRFPEGSKIKKHSTEYLRQIYVDSMVFTPEGSAPSGEARRPDHDWGPTTRFPGVRRSTTCSKTAGLSDADKRAILGETLAMLLKLT
jgi:aminocarboxymuconate-semialdehyde decarboxylase